MKKMINEGIITTDILKSKQMQREKT